jgi:hypothetical protein
VAQQLTRQPLYEQRLAIENTPGAGGSPELIAREELARIVAVATDLTMHGRQAGVFRELGSISVTGVVGAASFAALITGDTGARVHSLINRSGVQTFLAPTILTVDALRALAGFAVSGTVVRGPFRGLARGQWLTGTVTAGTLGSNGWNLSSTQTYPFAPPLWVEPGRVVIWSPFVANTQLDLLYDVSEPGAVVAT